MGIGLLNKENRVLSLELTARPLIADVKEEDVVVEKASEIDVRPSSKWKECVRTVADFHDFWAHCIRRPFQRL